jgi:cytochrome c556
MLSDAIVCLAALANGPMGAMSRPGGEFNKETAILGYERIAMLADMIPSLFVDDTTGADVTTRASDTIWANQEDFATHAANLSAAAKDAIASLEGGETDMRALSGSVGRTCGGCHDAYRLD